MHLQLWQWLVGAVEFGVVFAPIWVSIGRWERRRFEDKMLSEATAEAQLAHQEKNLLEARKAQADAMSRARDLQAKLDTFNAPIPTVESTENGIALRDLGELQKAIAEDFRFIGPDGLHPTRKGGQYLEYGKYHVEWGPPLRHRKWWLGA